MTHEVVYKIARAPEWEAAERTGVFEGSPDDKRDGFIHLSSYHKLDTTCKMHFAGEDGLLLVTIETRRLGPSLKWEPSRGGEIFPHLYGALPLSSVRSVGVIRVDGTGRPIFPLEMS